MEKLTDHTCRICGNERPPSAKTGRPKKYCGMGCKRVFEWKLKQFLIQIDACRHNLALVQTTTWWSHWIDVSAEQTILDRAEAELRDLLAG
jgi:hypothetical protein